MILHIDMDAFYASIEIRDDPKLRGKPVMVGGSPKGRGVVSAASYAAREFGIHSAMPASQAIRLCPNAVFVKPRMQHYADISKQIREIFFRFTPLVEPLALDEAFLDVAGSRQLFGEAVDFAKVIKHTIQDEIGITASAGVASNKFLAKVASDLDKPDGLVEVPPGQELDFLSPLPIKRVWGVGPHTEKRFHSLGIRTVGQIRALPKDTLKRAFGINSDHFWRLSRGIDSRPVVPDHNAKSISHETTFGFDISDREVLQAWLLELTEQVAIRLRRHEIKGRTIKLKIRFSDFRTISRSSSLPDPTSTTRTLWNVASSILNEALNQTHEPVRLLGMGVSQLSHLRPVQKELFDQEERDKQNRLDETCDQLREKFGRGSVKPATAIEQQIHLRPDPRVED